MTQPVLRSSHNKRGSSKLLGPLLQPRTSRLAGLRTVRLLASRFTYWFTLVMNVLGLVLGVMMLARPWFSLLSLEYLVSFYLMLLGVDCIILACSRLGSRR